MKLLLTFYLLFTFSGAFAQSAIDNDKEAILEKINIFFMALEKKDTLLYKSIVLPGGQIWTVRRDNDSSKIATRNFTDDFARIPKMLTTIEERALRTDITIHQDIAIAWVPYTLSLSGKFSHCGIDVFTFLKSINGWKIVNATYSIEPNGCAEVLK